MLISGHSRGIFESENVLELIRIKGGGVTGSRAREGVGGRRHEADGFSTHIPSSDLSHFTVSPAMQAAGYCFLSGTLLSVGMVKPGSHLSTAI